MFNSPNSDSVTTAQIQEEVQKMTAEDASDLLKFIRRMQTPNAFNHVRRLILRVKENVKAGWIRRVMERSVEILFHIEFALFPL